MATPHDTILPSRRVLVDRVVGVLNVKDSRILYCLPREATPSMEVVAFPGDGVPNPEWPSLAGALGTHPHSSGFLGALHDRLQREGGDYASAALFVVEPSDSSSQGFALFQNLLPCNLTASGEPLERYTGRERKAARHLAELLDAVYFHAKGSEAARAALASNAPIVALGFSKAGIVLNELLAEASTLECDDPAAAPDDAARLLARLRACHYLDAGLACRGAFLTEADVIASLGRLLRPPAVHLHGTPRQWKDAARAWVAEEKDRSAAMLRAAGVEVTERLYFAEEEPSLAMHFAVVGACVLPTCSFASPTPSDGSE